jgi:CspA family cold shock protein
VQTGIVKCWFEERGFGFLEGEDGDIFVHYSHIEGSGHKSLTPGQEVRYEAEPTPKGVCTTRVLPVPSAVMRKPRPENAEV